MKKMLDVITFEQDVLINTLENNPESIPVASFGTLNLGGSGTDIGELKKVADTVREFKEEKGKLSGKIILHKKFAENIFKKFGVVVVRNEDLTKTHSVSTPEQIEKELSYPIQERKKNISTAIQYVTFFTVLILVGTLIFITGPVESSNVGTIIIGIIISAIAGSVIGIIATAIVTMIISPKEGFLPEEKQKEALRKLFANPPSNLYDLLFGSDVARNGWNRITFKIFLPEHPELEKLKPMFAHALTSKGNVVVIADKKAIGFQFDEEKFKPFTDDPLFAIETDKYYILYPETAWGTTENEEKMIEEIKTFINEKSFSLFV